MEENCSVCSEKMESTVVSESRKAIKSLGLDDSQRDAILQCIALRECNHRNSVKLIWGPPGTGKTKTTASLLFSLFKMKCRTITCAPTNVAILGVAKRLRSCLNGTLEHNTYGLGDVVLSGNMNRMKIVDHEDVHDVFLDYRISALLYCFYPESGWKGSINKMIHLLEYPDILYQRYLEQFKRKDAESESGDDLVENGRFQGKSINDFMKKLVAENVKANGKNNKKKKNKASSQERSKSNCDCDGDGEGSMRATNDEAIVPLTFEEFFAMEFSSLCTRIVVSTELLYTHMPTSCLPLDEVMKMIKLLSVLQTIEHTLGGNKWSKGAFMGYKKSDLSRISLEQLKLLRKMEVPEFLERYEVKKFCLRNSRLIFCTVSSSAKMHETAPFSWR